MSNPLDTNEPTPDPQTGALLAEAGWVLALAKRLARDQAAAEDIAQGAITLALERRPSVGEGLRPWLAKVVGRLARHTVRSDVRRQDRESEAAPDRGSKSNDTDDVLERFELQQDLARRVDALTDPYRSVVIRRYYEGLSVKEIAKRTGASPGTVRSQLARGLASLRHQYTTEFEGHGALGVFLIAAGSGKGFLSRRTAELALMHTSTKVIAATSAALIVAVIAISPLLDDSEVVLEPTLNSQTELSEPKVALGTNFSVSAVESPVGEASRVAVESEVVSVATEMPVSVVSEETEQPVTRLYARLIGEHGESLAGATLSSIYPDGTRRGENSVAQSDGRGSVMLELSDDAVRKWRDQPLDMLFAANAPEHATTFVVKQLRYHGETDLGEIRLSAGGGLTGITVDENGQPITGAVLYAGASVLTGDWGTQQIIGPDMDVPRARTISAVDGTFELLGIQARLPNAQVASARIWAHAAGRLWTVTEAFTVNARGLKDVGRIVLKEVPRKLSIEGVVLRPDGYPAAGARVDFFSKGAPYGGQVTADANGGFQVVGKDYSAVDLIARDADGEFGMSAEVIAERGERVELVLRERRKVLVNVVDTEGKPIEDVHLMPVLADGLVPGEDWSYTNEMGQVTIDAPGGSFSVWARKTGFGEGREGPFTYESVPESVTISMQRGAHVSGRVLAYGKPVAGATVTAMRMHQTSVSMTGGFPHRYPTGVPGVISDEEGRFTVPIRHNWPEIGVIATAPGLATGEFVPVDWPNEEAHDIEIHMTEGGVIEGVVTPPPGLDAAGLFVGASRGDGLPLSTITDSGGRYRFEGLTPGNWRVEGRLREVGTEMLSISRHPDDMEPKWNAVVVDRQTLEFDVDMRHLLDVEVRGQLRIDGIAPPSGWTVSVVRPRHEHHLAEVSAVQLDSKGRFAFTANPGRGELRFVGSMSDGVTIEIFREVRLQGSLFDWSDALSTVPVEEWLESYPDQARIVRGEEDAGDRELTLVPVNSDGILKARVPIGTSSLQIPTSDESSRSGWETIRTLENL